MLTHDYPKEVTLKDGRKVTLRSLSRTDFEPLRAFFHELPAEDRIFLRHNVDDPELIRRWTANVNFDEVIPIVAFDGERIVADGTLHFYAQGWLQHVGHVRVVIARSHRHVGLGTVICRELVALAEERELEKLQAHVIEDDAGSLRMFQRLGFQQSAVLPELVKDVSGQPRNLVVLINEVANLGRIMEDWIMDSMIPAYRIPGGGEG